MERSPSDSTIILTSSVLEAFFQYHGTTAKDVNVSNPHHGLCKFSGKKKLSMYVADQMPLAATATSMLATLVLARTFPVNVITPGRPSFFISATNDLAIKYLAVLFATLPGGSRTVNEACVMRSFVEPFTNEMPPQNVRKNTKAVTPRLRKFTSDTSDKNSVDKGSAVFIIDIRAGTAEKGFLVQE